jgi:cell division septal protein FtsQ
MSSTLERPPAIDRRIAARRQTVREAGARRRLKWLLMLLGLAGGGALVAWLLYQSTFLAVASITVDGQFRSDAASIITDEGIAPGMPTVNVPANELEAALLRDPWVAAVDVTVRWPGTVEVTLVEHVPSAWVQVGDRWALAARDGAIMEVAAAIPRDAPRIDVGVATAVPGASLESLAAIGALELIDALPAALVSNVLVEGDDSGLYGVVGGFLVDFGYPSDMAAKATALVVLLDSQTVASGSAISVVSPDRPAILPPAPPGSLDETTPEGEGVPNGESDDGAGQDAAGE